MKKTLSTIALATCLMFGVATVTPAMAMTNEETGAAVGGGVGAVAGALIGEGIHHSAGAALGGAAIGIVPGAIAGYLFTKWDPFGWFGSK